MVPILANIFFFYAEILPIFEIPICNALMMITGVIETFAICRLYRFIGRDFHYKAI